MNKKTIALCFMDFSSLHVFKIKPKMNATWIGRNRPITIGPIGRLSTHLISPQCDVTRRQTNERSICLHYSGSCSAHAQNAPP